MTSVKKRGYRVERNTRLLFEKYGWKTMRAGASLGEADLICLKNGVCLLIQVKSTKKKKFYYYEYMEPDLQGFRFYLVVDFGYGKVRIMPPRKQVVSTDGELLEEFLVKFKS